MYLVNVFLFITLLSAVKCLSLFGHRHGIDYLLEDFNETLALFDNSPVETKFIEQPVDNFNKNDNRTWKMRYLQRLDMWKMGGPIYLFIGGEWIINENWLRTGTTYELAQETNGAIFYSEHRYYGDSKPFNYSTPENLKYLSSRQALADIARLLKSIKGRSEFADSKVVVVGGSYAANLAVWLNEFYPKLVDATLASSGPVEAKTDFYKYLEQVGEDYKKHGSPQCYRRIELLFKFFENQFQSNEGIERLKRICKICPEVDLTKLQNKQLFFQSSLMHYMGVAQYGTVKDIQEYCLRYDVKAASFNNDDMWNQNKNCCDMDFDNYIQIIKKSDLLSWLYQTCTEFGYFQTTSSDNQPFMKNVGIDFYIRICKAMFGQEFDKKRIDDGVKKTNNMYGGLHPKVSKVLFSNGDLDPWHNLSVLKDISTDVLAKVIPYVSHCKDLVSDKYDDTQEIKEARKFIKKTIKKWISSEDCVLEKLFGTQIMCFK